MRNKTFIFLALFLCFGFKLFSYTYYLPHIHTGSDAWETYLIIDNAADSELSCFVYYVDEDGKIFSNDIFKVSPASTLKVSLREKNASWLFINAGDKRLRFRVGYIAKDSLGGGTAEFVLRKGLLNAAMFRLSNYYDKLTWSGFALTNGLNETITVTPYLYTDNGMVEGIPFQMAPYQKIVAMFDDFFGTSYTDIKFVVFKSNKTAIQGVVISGEDNDKLLFSAPSEASRDWAAGWGMYYDYAHVGAIIPKNGEFAVFYTYDFYDNEGNWMIRNVSYNGMKYIGIGRKITGVRILGGFTEYSSKTHTYVYGVTLEGKYFIHKWETNYTDSFHIEPDSCPASSGPYEHKIVAASSETVFGVMYKNQNGNVAVKFFDINDGSEIASYVSDKTGYAGFIFFDGSNFYAGYTYDNGSGVNDYISVLKFDSSGQNKTTVLNGRFADVSSLNKNNYLLDAAILNNILHVLTATAINTGVDANDEVVQVDTYSVNINSPSVSNFARGYLRFFDYAGVTGKVLVPSDTDLLSDYFYVTVSYADYAKGSMIYYMTYSTDFGYAWYKTSRAIPYSIKQAYVIPASAENKTLFADEDSCVFLCEDTDITGEPDAVTGIKFYNECIIVKSPYSDIMKAFTPDLPSLYR